MINNEIVTKCDELGLNAFETILILFTLEYFQENVNDLVEWGILNDYNEHLIRENFLVVDIEQDNFVFKYPIFQDSFIDDFGIFKQKLISRNMTSTGHANGKKGNAAIISFGQATRFAYESLKRKMGSSFDLDVLVTCVVDFYSITDFPCKLEKFLENHAQFDMEVVFNANKKAESNDEQVLL